MSFIKSLVRKMVRKVGYQIQKYPALAFSSVPVFDLSVQVLMATRGTGVSFIQVGANDGSYGDPLRKYIMKYPWHGILVEPQPDIFAKLCENYAAVKSRLIFENIAIAGDRTTIAMYRAGSSNSSYSGRLDYAASVVSADSGVVARQLGVNPRTLERFMVPCATLDALIKKHDMSNIHVLQIDAEGHDYQVLKTLNLATNSPLIIQFEHGHLTPREIGHAVEYLNLHGYRILYGGNQIDSIALHNSFLSSID